MKNAAVTTKPILEIPNSLICHVCNTAGGFGSGFAGFLADKLPDVKIEYKKLFNDRQLELGKNSYHVVEPNVSEYLLSDKTQHSYHVCNMYAMRDYRRTKTDHTNYLDYSAFANCLLSVNRHVNMHNLLPVFPYGVGSGNAGGDWEFICNLLDKHLEFYILCKLPQSTA